MSPRTIYSEDEDDIMREMEGQPTRDIAARLDRDIKSVGNRMAWLGLKRVRHIETKVWDSRMDGIVRRYIASESFENIGHRLGVTKSAVAGYVRRQGLVGSAVNGYTAWTEEQEQFLRDNVNKLTMVELGREIGREASTISKKLARMGIKPEARVTVFKQPKPARPEAVEVTPVTARPWQTRGRNECKYPFGPRGAILSCCDVEWGDTGYCESHAALCGGYRKVAA